MTTTTRERFRPNPVALGLLRSGLEIRQFFRARDSMIFSFAFPIMLLVIFASIFNFEIAPGVKFTQYFIAGMIAAAQLTNGFQTLAIQIPIERDRGVLKRLAGSPMPPASYFIGKVVMVYTIGLIETALMLAIAGTLFDLSLPDTPAKWLTLAWVTMLGIAACTLCGIAFSSIPREGKRAPAVVTPVALVLQFISGVFFVFTNLPSWMQHIAAVFPLKWMTQGMRSVFLPDSFASQEAAGSWELGKVALILGVWVVIGFTLCVLTFRWTAKEER
ncbi:ABC transporter permease [Phytohabitans rumicis]|uniref:Transport permease protein n=1 Tax=Phytohabitans rumicis TaxID=1076125 RepID=A0A6V8KXI0_9ACTN|nr:ABC transporter permease [Phytohabitans rumicis]GFJ87388.1 transport permease protein [Phytohabitans rumicis]